MFVRFYFSQRANFSDGISDRINSRMALSQRSKTIDGFRGIAVLFVVFSHAVTYRFGSVEYPFSNYVQRLAGPLAEIGVQIFFVISGYIITTLL